MSSAEVSWFASLTTFATVPSLHYSISRYLYLLLSTSGADLSAGRVPGRVPGPPPHLLPHQPALPGRLPLHRPRTRSVQ